MGHERAFVGGPTTSPNKSKLADNGRIEFRKMLLSPYWTVVLAQNLVQRCNTTTRRCPHNQKRNRKLIHMTSSVERL